MQVRRVSLVVLFPLVAAACSAAPAPAGDSDDLYEDIPDDGGKADTSSLSPIHAVARYTPLREGRVVTADLTFAGATKHAGDRLLLIRGLEYDRVPSYVAVDVDWNTMGVLTAAEVTRATRVAEDGELGDASYVLALSDQRDAAFSSLVEWQTPGLTRFALTIDMCPSSHTYHKDLFAWLVRQADAQGAPVSIGIALTGLWATGHPKEFKQLVDWQKTGKLDITWINHSYRHELSRDANGVYHFLTASSINFEADVLDLERLLLGQGLPMSPLFRFPGLTHDVRRRSELNDLSLFALDADAWIGKGQPIKQNAVVLVHGNGNERAGITGFLSQTKALGEDNLLMVPPTEVIW